MENKADELLREWYRFKTTPFPRMLPTTVIPEGTDPMTVQAQLMRYQADHLDWEVDLMKRVKEYIETK